MHFVLTLDYNYKGHEQMCAKMISRTSLHSTKVRYNRVVGQDYRVVFPFQDLLVHCSNFPDGESSAGRNL